MDDALSDLDQAIELGGRSFSALLLRGRVQAWRGDRRAASSDLKEATELHPRSAKPFIQLGRLHLFFDPAKARQYFLKGVGVADGLVAQCPGDVGALVDSALASYEAGQHDRSLRKTNRAIALDPMHLGARLLRARLLELRGDRVAALADLDAAIEIAPRHPDAYLVRAMVKVRLGRETEAKADYLTVSRLLGVDLDLLRSRRPAVSPW